ncbi:MAG: RT0821/Lpp0805 family surface protein [Pseudomonadota bacterium]
MKRKFYAVIIATLLLSGCAGNKQGSGTAIGAVTGGLLGSMFGKGEGRLLAIGAGALGGAFLGNTIGKGLDDQDKMLLEKTSAKALEYSPSGNTTEWRNPDSGHHGYITPSKAYRDNSGEYCREYTQVIVVGGEKQKAFGKACRKPDGHWEIIQ